MTLSVGLGKVINDPTASILTRKALGRLSTPGMLVTDEGLTIDNDGRMVLRLKPGGGLTEDEAGLFLTGVITVDGITGGVAAGSGVWNVYMSGTAANYFAGSVAIGTTTLTAKLGVLSPTEQLRLMYDGSNYCKTTVAVTGATTIQTVGTDANLTLVPGSGVITVTGSVAIGTTTLTAKLGVLSTTEQLRLLYDASNYAKVTVGGTGVTTIEAVGTDAGIRLVTQSGQGISINGTRIIKTVVSTDVSITIVTSPRITNNATGISAADGSDVIITPNGEPDIYVTSVIGYISGGLVIIRITSAASPSSYSQSFKVTVIT